MKCWFGLHYTRLFLFETHTDYTPPPTELPNKYTWTSFLLCVPINCLLYSYSYWNLSFAFTTLCLTRQSLISQMLPTSRKDLNRWIFGKLRNPRTIFQFCINLQHYTTSLFNFLCWFSKTPESLSRFKCLLAKTKSFF